MGYIYCLGGFIEPSKSLGRKYEPSEKFRGQKQTLFFFKNNTVNYTARRSTSRPYIGLFFWITPRRYVEKS
jgi:hypothetical protein